MKYTILALLFTLNTANAADIDAELNSTYQQALKLTRDPESLKSAQRLWLKFIKSDCHASSFGLGGSDSLMIKDAAENCINEYKSDRTLYFKKQYLD